MSANSFRADLFAGHVALVCGGTSGIGAAIGSALAGLGAEVTVSGATPAEADAARERAGFAGSAIALDVRDGEGVEAGDPFAGDGGLEIPLRIADGQPGRRIVAEPQD